MRNAEFAWSETDCAPRPRMAGLPFRSIACRTTFPFSRRISGAKSPGGTRSSPRRRNSPPPISFTTQSGQTYDHVRWSLGAPGLAVLDADGWTTIPFAELPEDLTSFPPELQKAITARRSAPGDQQHPDGFRHLHGQGWDEIRQRPGDAWRPRRACADAPRLDHAFPPPNCPMTSRPSRPSGVRRCSPPPSATARRSVTQVVSFTTRKGKLYTDVQAAIEDKGLRLLTWDGWIAVPFDQLPEDLSSFPEGWREKILQKRAKLHSASAAH